MINQELKEKLCNEILPLVTKPGRYLGNEYNAIVKDHSKIDLKIALAFPDIYDLGMSHLGFKIFYELLNNKPNYVAERVFAPWPDMEQLMRKNDIQLYSLETYTPIKQFDILAISLQHELCFTTVLNMLDLAGIPVFSKQRTENNPIVIAGGHAAFNPEPIALFIDAFVIGDGEESILEVSETILKAKQNGLKRNDVLHELAKLQGVYVPSLYQVDYLENGMIKEIKPVLNDIPKRIIRRAVDLEEAYYPIRQVVPFIELVHDRVALEIQRGCTRGCRFCQAGYITRPRRERSIKKLMRQAAEGIHNTGLNEVALLSLSSSDYDGIQELVTRMVNHFEPGHVSISLPSLRLDTFSIEIAKLTQRVKKTGFTFAVEAGSERLRNVINKTISNADLENAIIRVFSNGWLNAKLYFMIGLPTENEKDLEETVWLINRVGQLAKKHAKRHCKITASFSVFVPKPHSAFENAPQLDRAEVQRRIYWIKDRITSNTVKIKWHDPEQSYLEGVCSRGDRQIANAIYLAWKKGCNLDNWSDQFHKDRWEQAFKETGINPDDIALRQREEAEILPWSHIDSGITRKFLLKEYKNGIEENTIGDCSIDKFCSACGLEDCTHIKSSEKFFWPSQVKSDYQDIGQLNIPVEEQTKGVRFRIKFSKLDDIRFISHLDLMRTFSYVIRRSGIPIAYSRGFNPQMKFHLALALSLGYASIAEYAEFELTDYLTVDEFTGKLNKVLPPGLIILKCWMISPDTPGFGKIIHLVSYRITQLPASLNQALIRSNIHKIMTQTTLPVVRVAKNGVSKQIDIRPLIESVTYRPDFSIDLCLKVTPTGIAKPEEILNLLFKGNEINLKLLHITRTGLYSVANGFPVPLDRLGKQNSLSQIKLAEYN